MGGVQVSNQPEVQYSDIGERVMRNRTPLPASTSFVADRYAPQAAPQSAAPQGLSDWRGRGGMTEADMAGMTGRDFNEFVKAYEPILRGKQQRDYLAEIALKNQGALNVQESKGKTAEKVANLRLDSTRMVQDRSDVRAELDRRVKEKGLSEAARHNLIAEQIGWARIQEAKQRFRMAHSQNERLKAAQMLLQHSNALAGARSRVLGSDTGIMSYENDDIASMLGEWEADAEQSKALAEQFISQATQAPSGQTVIESESSKTPGTVGPQGKKPAAVKKPGAVKNPFNK